LECEQVEAGRKKSLSASGRRVSEASENACKKSLNSVIYSIISRTGGGR
jgi:hypothetical protein